MRHIALTVTISLSMLSFGTRSVRAQFIEPPPQRRVVPTDSSGIIAAGTSSSKPINELLQQATFDYSSDAAVLRLKVARLWAEPLKGRYFPIYLMANPSALIPASEDSVRYTAKELLNQFGGLLNLAVAKPWVLPGSIAGQVGPQLEARFGAKYVQIPTATSGSIKGTAVGQAAINGSWLVRLWNDQDDEVLKSRPDTVTQRGVVALNLRATANYLGGRRYRDLFRDDDGKTPPSLLGSGQVDVTIHLFDEAYMAFGYTWSSSKLVEGTGFAGFTLSRRRSPAGS